MHDLRVECYMENTNCASSASSENWEQLRVNVDYLKTTLAESVTGWFNIKQSKIEETLSPHFPKTALR